MQKIKMKVPKKLIDIIFFSVTEMVDFINDNKIEPSQIQHINTLYVARLMYWEMEEKEIKQ